MHKSNTGTIIVLVFALMGGLLSPPVSAVSIMWKAPNVDITLGLPASSLEFEDPTAVGKLVKGYTVIDWLDADYNKAGHPQYDEWSVSHPGQVQGNINEIWMRNGTQSIWTATTVGSNIVSIHMTGDNNDGKAEVLVDGVVVAILDMGTAGLPQTALIVVKNLVWNTHTILVRDAGVGPLSRLGDDVATFGAAALQTNQPVKWWPHFWFCNARLRLYYTGGWIGTPTGFWWGWYPYNWYGYYLQPWYGPAGWYQPYCSYVYRPYWDYWPWYRYYRPWWHNWRWLGGYQFWGFNDYLHYRYWYWQPRIIYYWSWYWDPQGQGGCMELVTQGDENNPSGSRILPFPDPNIPGFEAGEHAYSVNGGKVTGTFSTLEFISVSYLESYYRSIAGVTEDDVNALMGSDIVQKLMENGTGYVGVQHATWTHPEPTIATDAGALGAEVTTGGTAGTDQCTFGIWLTSPPLLGYTTVALTSPDNNRLTIDGADSDGLCRRYFDSMNWEYPQYVTVRAVATTVDAEDYTAKIAAFNEADPNEGFMLPVVVRSSGCGRYGYNVTDLNNDCHTDFRDFAYIADQWLYSTMGD